MNRLIRKNKEATGNNKPEEQENDKMEEAIEDTLQVSTETNDLLEAIKQKVDNDNENNCIGTLDQPMPTDEFKIEKYTVGLTSFITKCVTPMTIAIQGEWGSGKSSVMQMVIEEIDKNNKTTNQDNKEICRKIHCTTVNTWQFSQFNSESNLSTSLMQAIIDGFEDKKGPSKFTKIKNNIAQIGITVLKGATARFIEGFDVDEAIEGFVKVNKIIQDLKDSFQQSVYEAMKEHGVDRIAIFIDDFDRLEPERAVELLEVLKTFLDCKGCVFILAIDYNVVVSGVKTKYKYGNDKNDEEKCRSFFDKIIQVPFKMPVAMYDVSNFVHNALSRIAGISDSNRKDSIYVKLIENSIGQNPRSMKRLFNSFVLQLEIAGTELSDDIKSKTILFATLCMHLQFEELYGYIVSNLENLQDEYFNRLASDDLEIVASELKENGVISSDDDSYSEEQSKSIRGFIRVFNTAITPSDDGKVILNKELETAKKFIKISSMTATGKSEDKAESKEKKAGKERTKEINEWFKDYIERSQELKHTNPHQDKGTFLLFTTDNFEDTFKRFALSENIKGSYTARYGLSIRSEGIKIGPGIMAPEETSTDEREKLYNKLKEITGLGNANPDLTHSGGTIIHSNKIAPDAYTREDITRETFEKMLDDVVDYDKKMFGTNN